MDALPNVVSRWECVTCIHEMDEPDGFMFHLQELFNCCFILILTAYSPLFTCAWSSRLSGLILLSLPAFQSLLLAPTPLRALDK